MSELAYSLLLYLEHANSIPFTYARFLRSEIGGREWARVAPLHTLLGGKEASTETFPGKFFSSCNLSSEFK